MNTTTSIQNCTNRLFLQNLSKPNNTVANNMTALTGSLVLSGLLLSCHLVISLYRQRKALANTQHSRKLYFDTNHLEKSYNCKTLEELKNISRCIDAEAKNLPSAFAKTEEADQLNQQQEELNQLNRPFKKELAAVESKLKSTFLSSLLPNEKFPVQYYDAIVAWIEEEASCIEKNDQEVDFDNIWSNNILPKLNNKPNKKASLEEKTESSHSDRFPETTSTIFRNGLNFSIPRPVVLSIIFGNMKRFLSKILTPLFEMVLRTFDIKRSDPHEKKTRPSILKQTPQAFSYEAKDLSDDKKEDDSLSLNEIRKRKAEIANKQLKSYCDQATIEDDSKLDNDNPEIEKRDLIHKCMSQESNLRTQKMILRFEKQMATERLFQYENLIARNRCRLHLIKKVEAEITSNKDYYMQISRNFCVENDAQSTAEIEETTESDR